MAAVNWKKTLFIFVASLIILFLAYLSAYEALSKVMPVVVYVAGGLLIISGVLIALGFWYTRFEQFRTIRVQYSRDRDIARADAAKATAEAQKAQVMVITAPKGHQLVIRDADRSSDYRQLHLNPNSMVNGHYEKPDQLQLQIYNQYLGQRKADEVIIDQPDDLPFPLLDQPSDWIQSIVLPAPHVHYCGPTRSGKTTLANHQLEHIARRWPDTRFYLLNPKATAARKPFIIKPDYSDISEGLDGLAAFNKLMIQRKNNPQLTQDIHRIVFVIDEWDWIYYTYSQEAIRLLVPLVKVGAELKIQVILIGQSPLSGDTGLSQSFYYNMVRVAIWQEGSRLLRDYPLDKKYKAPLVARYEQLKVMAPEFKADTGQELRYCTVVPMAGNPSVQVIPFLSDPEPIRQRYALNKQAVPTPEEREKLLVWWQMKQDGTLSGNALHQAITGQETNASGKQIQTLRDLVTKFGKDPGF